MRARCSAGPSRCRSRLDWIPFRADTLEVTLAMWSKLLAPSQYLGLGMRESAYLVAALTLLALIAGWLAKTYVFPRLRGRPVLWSSVEVAGYAVVISLVFVFLRPISQFIYFQF